MDISVFPLNEAHIWNVGYHASPLLYSFSKGILSTHRQEDHLIFKDAIDNLMIFKNTGTLVILSIVALYYFISKYENGQRLFNIWAIFVNIIQRNCLEYPSSRILRCAFYMFMVFIYAFYNNNIKTDIVVNDSNKPINHLKQLLEPQKSHLRTIWMLSERIKLGYIHLDNHSDDYTKVINRAFKMNISNSFAGYSISELNKYVTGVMEEKYSFIGSAPLIRLFKKKACSKLNDVEDGRKRIVWISSEEFAENPIIWLIKKLSPPNKRRIIENSWVFLVP